MFNEQVITLDKINGVGSGKIYSKNEFATGGTWIDDRIVYSKVVTHNNVVSNISYEIPHGISNLGLVISYSGIIKSEDKSFQCSMENADIIETGSFYISGSNIVFATRDGIGGGPFNATIILEYVKEIS